jgi:tyrosyl-tRNA synthetase
VDDRDVIQFLKYFTFLSKEEIEALELQHQEKPELRAAHKALAMAATDLIHGKQGTLDAIKASEILFGGALEGISEELFKDVAGEAPSKDLDTGKLGEAGIGLTELLVHAGLAASKGQAKKDLEGGGVYINNVRETNLQRMVTDSDLLFNKYILLRKGKRNYAVIVAV